MNMPALNNWNINQDLPMLIPNSLQTPLKFSNNLLFICPNIDES
jgi:hypothetical protein